MRKLDVRKELNRSRTRAVNATKTRKYYTATDKEVKKSVRKDKLDHNANMAKQTIEAAGQGTCPEYGHQELCNNSRQTSQ